MTVAGLAGVGRAAKIHRRHAGASCGRCFVFLATAQIKWRTRWGVRHFFLGHLFRAFVGSFIIRDPSLEIDSDRSALTVDGNSTCRTMDWRDTSATKSTVNVGAISEMWR